LLLAVASSCLVPVIRTVFCCASPGHGSRHWHYLLGIQWLRDHVWKRSQLVDLAVLPVPVLLDHSVLVTARIQVQHLPGMCCASSNASQLLHHNARIQVIFVKLLQQPAESAFSLGLFEIRTDNVWIGLGVLYNVCFYFAVIIACSVSFLFQHDFEAFPRLSQCVRSSAAC
jgi:hypothetical protein